MNTPSHPEWSAERMALLRRIHELEEENARLRELLCVDIREERPKEQPLQLSLQEKVELFRSLFKGREDVFARRWVSKANGKAGYQPVCTREWNPLFCNKKKFKCSECPNRELASLTYDDIYNHLAGKDADGRDVIGVYAIMEDNRCNFLCIDFDDKQCVHGYKNDVLSFTEVCKRWDIPYCIEKSRSGNGAHVWIFFETPILAAKARKLGFTILTEAINSNGRVSFDSYDRIIPNQDTLPEGGFGNLIALPLQGQARKNGCSVFVDEAFVPFDDQWRYLTQVERLSELQLDGILNHQSASILVDLSKTSESKPWELPEPTSIRTEDFSANVIVSRANMLYIPYACMSAKTLSFLRCTASFKNPDFYSRQAMRLPTYSIPRIISCAEISDEYLGLPRGCEDAVVKLLEEKCVNYTIVDKTNAGASISVRFNGVLRDEQSKALDCLLRENTGVLSATTAFGKTVTASALIAARGVNTLILVHTKALLDQWKKSLEEFLDIDYTPEDTTHKRGRKKAFSPIGCLCSSENSLHGIIDIAIMQSCVSDNEVKSFVLNYGMVIADECHHVSAFNFEKVLKYCNARYVYGLTATPIRKDGHQPIIFMQCGPIRYIVDAKEQMSKQSFERLLVPRFTNFRLLTDDNTSFTQICQELSADNIRNQLLVNDVIKVLKEGRSPIVLTGLTSHVDKIASMLRPLCNNVVTLIGSETAKEKRIKQSFIQSIPPTEPLVIVATGKYVGEGFDCPRLDTLFLALPISWKGIVAQYAGRLHREYAGKREVLIYDYVDVRVPMCDIMYRRRLKGYAAIGYKIRTDKIFFDTPQPSVNIIYGGENFQKPFLNDVGKAKESVIISSPKVRLGRNILILDILQELSLKGTRIVIFTKESNSDVDKMRQRGIDVVLKLDLTLCCSIIDKQQVWYGSINILGYHTADDNAMRFCDTEIADNLLDMLCG